MERIQSPRTDDSAIENEIIAKGLTAPRIAPADIEANIAAESYFTAAEGGGGRQPVHPAHKLLTFCMLVLRNGFTVTGESACASPENFDAELGRKIARANAVSKVWPLMGYQLKEQLYQRTQPAQAPISDRPPHQQRVIDELAALQDKLNKLVAFLATPLFDSLPTDEKERMVEQEGCMADYANVLARRIAAFQAV